jgi:PRTRC genetic system ThiF family protein
MNTLTAVHFTDSYLVNPANPITVNLIGAGGTGSQMLTSLARMNQAMLALDYPGLMVTVYDDDTVSPANLGRQLFAQAEVGLCKSVALINRINRFFGTNWKAVTRRYDTETLRYLLGHGKANLYITCVDHAAARFEVGSILGQYRSGYRYDRNKPLYWMDLGNSKDTGQVLLSTIGHLKQPTSENSPRWVTCLL